MFEKNPVKGASKQALYQHLIANSKTTGEVGWNFEKFLIDRNGRVAGRFKSSVDPESHALTDAIEIELK
jgi:glutathione peroxidase